MVKKIRVETYDRIGEIYNALWNEYEKKDKQDWGLFANISALGEIQSYLLINDLVSYGNSEKRENLI